MKKLVLLAVGAILLLGVLAVAAVLLVGDGSDPATTATPDRGPVQPSGPVVPAPPAATGPAPAPPIPGPRRVQLPRARVVQALSEPVAGCFKSHPVRSSLPAVLTLELEAQASGGYAVLGSSVKSWGGATAGLVDCVRKSLPGQVVPGGSFTPGERAVYDFSLEPPPSIAPPPPVESPPSTLPTNRQPPARRGGTAR